MSVNNLSHKPKSDENAFEPIHYSDRSTVAAEPKA